MLVNAVTKTCEPELLCFTQIVKLLFCFLKKRCSSKKS